MPPSPVVVPSQPLIEVSDVVNDHWFMPIRSTVNAGPLAPKIIVTVQHGFAAKRNGHLHTVRAYHWIIVQRVCIANGRHR